MTRSLHVVHVLHSLDVGGTENGVVNLTHRLAAEFRQTVVTMTTGARLAGNLPAGVALHPVGKRPGLDLAALVRLTALLRSLRPDVVHSRNWAAFDAVWATRLARAGVVIHGEHGRAVTDPHGLDPRRNRLRRVLAPLVHRFVAVSGDLRRWLIDVVGISERKVIAIPNGVDTGRFADPDRERGRAALGVDDGVRVIGTVGRLDPVKDHAGLVDAFATLARHRADVVLAIVGEGPARAAVEARIAARGVGDRVRLLGERRDVPVLLGGFDVFALPSLAEGMSNTLLEAMASGLPIVATAVGGNPELVADGATGALVPPGDAVALARALGAYLDDPLPATLHGKAAHERAIARFSLERMAASYRDLYRAAAKAGG